MTSDIIGGILMGLAISIILLMIFVDPPAAVAYRHCKARGLTYTKTLDTGEIQCARVIIVP